MSDHQRCRNAHCVHASDDQDMSRYAHDDILRPLRCDKTILARRRQPAARGVGYYRSAATGQCRANTPKSHVKIVRRAASA